MIQGTTQEKINLSLLTKQAMENFVHAQGWKSYRAEQILRWLYQQRATHIEQMTDLSMRDRQHLKSIARISLPTIHDVIYSNDGTAKFLIKLTDSQIIETVLIPEGDRRTVCISTQVGCSLDCTFCLTAKLGLLRNLDAAEIIGQFLAVQNYLRETYNTPPRLTNVVMMGMGEPLANLGPLRDAIQHMIHARCGLGLSPRRITVSTAGIHQNFQEIIDLGVNLAISLNASTNEQRNTLMPSANKICSLPELLAVCRNLPLPNRRRLTFEYVLLKNINDSAQDAIRLANSIRGIPCMVNVIPFNEIPASPYSRPSEARILEFQDILINRNIDTYLRKSKGPDVLGACGQLGASTRG